MIFIPTVGFLKNWEGADAVGDSHLFTSESVTEGHPDKMADQISDAILDAMVAGDARSRVAVETLVTRGMALVAGEVTTETYVPISDVIRETVKGIGYTKPEYGFDYEDCSVLVCIGQQSPDIAMGVDESAGHEQGAGHQEGIQPSYPDCGVYRAGYCRPFRFYRSVLQSDFALHCLLCVDRRRSGSGQR